MAAPALIRPTGTFSRWEKEHQKPSHMTDLRLLTFPDSEALAEALAARVADALRDALAARDMASLAVSGGTTPKRFLRALAAQSLDWSGVRVTLVDERWVGEGNERSNAALVREHLLHGAAAQAHFVPLYRDVPRPEDALAEVDAALAPLLPLDVAVLGMGPDGHTASFFPGGDRLAEALDPAASARVLPIRAPGAGEPRITLTLPVLREARHLFLHIEGEAKREVLQRAAGPAGRELPVSAVLDAAEPPEIYWCP